MKKENINNKDLRIGLISLMGALVILFIIGLFVFKPEPITIQGEADATEVRISGKIPGRIKLFLTEEGAKIKAGRHRCCYRQSGTERKTGTGNSSRRRSFSTRQKSSERRPQRTNCWCI